MWTPLLLLLFVSEPGLAPAPNREALLRELVAETALAQLTRPDPHWQASQQDCAGLVRFAYRSAYARVEPAREARGLFLDGAGRPAAFANAETLLAGSFGSLGRGPPAQAALRSGDLLAFRQGGPGEEALHLMLVIGADDPAHGPLSVVYHTGTRGEPLRGGPLDSLVRDAPAEWRPSPQNPAFLGFFRWKEWLHG